MQENIRPPTEELEMSVKQIARLYDWLVAKGHTSQEISECLHYIAESSAPIQTEEIGQNKKPDHLPSRNER